MQRGEHSPYFIVTRDGVCASTVAQFYSVTQSCLTLCDSMNRSTPGLPVHHQFPELAQTHVHRLGDAIQPSQPLSSPSSPALNLSQHQGLFPSDSAVKNSPLMQETWVQSLGRDDPLEKGMATHSSILAWRIPWTEESGRLGFIVSQKTQTRLRD